METLPEFYFNYMLRAKARNYFSVSMYHFFYDCELYVIYPKINKKINGTKRTAQRATTRFNL